MTPEQGREAIQKFQVDIEAIRQQLRRVIVGHDAVVEGLLVAFFANGHVLLEGVPGLGKTLLIKTLSRALGLEFRRIQFTPDLMPADIIGTQLVVEEDGAKVFQFAQGPVFTPVLLADEVNRATPKTQSALLEAMEERQVTVAGQTRQLPKPFFVMATQNPIEMEGTYPLPEAQLDRFMFKLLVQYPTEEELRHIVQQTTIESIAEAEPVWAAAAAADRVRDMQQLVRQVIVPSDVEKWVVRVVMATHPGGAEAHTVTTQYVSYGASPRACQAMILGGKVLALLDGRGNLDFSDVERLAVPALSHRLVLNFEAEADRVTAVDIVRQLLVDHSQQAAV